MISLDGTPTIYKALTCERVAELIGITRESLTAMVHAEKYGTASPRAGILITHAGYIGNARTFSAETSTFDVTIG